MSLSDASPEMAGGLAAASGAADRGPRRPAAVAVRGLVKTFSDRQKPSRKALLAALLRAAAGRPPVPLEAARDSGFRAVDGVSFEVHPGEAFALIGPNGCGKTTTLRMVAGLIRPDAGEVSVRGRVQALIALGAGFHDRLSGRENVLNNAAVLGIGGREARRLLGPVAEFAGIGDFLDRPVGSYSSGMRARLGFAVAVSLEPDVLLVDEVLAVGDAAFQNRCFGRMNELLARGVAVVLVSHSHNQVVQMCERAAWLDRGRVRQLGPADSVVKAYLDQVACGEREPAGASSRPVGVAGEADAEPGKTATSPAPRGSHPFGLDRLDASGLYGAAHERADAVRDLWVKVPARVDGREPFHVDFGFTLTEEVRGLNVTLNLYREDGLLLSAVSTLNGNLLAAPRSGPVACRVRLRRFAANPCRCVLGMSVHLGHRYLWRGAAAEFAVAPGPGLRWGLLDVDPEVELIELPASEASAPEGPGARGGDSVG